MNATTLISEIRDLISQGVSIDATSWLDYAVKLNLCLSDEHDKLFAVKLLVAQQKAKSIAEGNSVAKAEVLIEATPDFIELKKQEARIALIEEFIRLAKSHARLKSEELKSYGLH